MNAEHEFSMKACSIRTENIQNYQREEMREGGRGQKERARTQLTSIRMNDTCAQALSSIMLCIANRKSTFE